MLAIPNAISFLFLLAAIYFARKKQIRAHKTMVFCCMLISLVLVYLFAEMRLQGAYIMAPIWAYSSISGVIVFVLAGSPNQPPKQTKEKHHFLLNY